MNRFSASYGTGVKIISISITLLLAGIAIFMTFMNEDVLKPLPFPVFVFYIFVVLTLAIPYILSIDSYSILPGESIVINKVIGKVRIPFSNLTQIDVIPANKMWLSIRLFGSGGLYGYFGIFYNKLYGRMTWYATQKKNTLVIITRDNKKILITPDDLNGLLNALPKELINRKDHV
jgi:hypothetical protein